MYVHKLLPCMLNFPSIPIFYIDFDGNSVISEERGTHMPPAAALQIWLDEGGLWGIFIYHLVYF